MNRPAFPSEPPPGDRGSPRSTLSSAPAPPFHVDPGREKPCCTRTRFLPEAVRGGEGGSSRLCRLLTRGVVTWGRRGTSQGWGAAVPVRWAKCCIRKSQPLGKVKGASCSWFHVGRVGRREVHLPPASEVLRIPCVWAGEEGGRGRLEGPGEDVKARPGRVGIACHWPEQFTAPIASGVGGGGNGHSLRGSRGRERGGHAATSLLPTDWQRLSRPKG